MRSSYLRVHSLLWNISYKMAFRIRKEKENRLKKHAKTAAELFGGSSKLTTVNDEKTIQCHAPIVGCVRKGTPLPLSTTEDGVKMCCTNDKCEYARQLVHSECFEMLENHLIKIISNIGSARGWTELQRRHNLWEKKGLTLVQKLLRCKCDRGQMVRDTDFYKEVKDTEIVEKTEEHSNNKLKKKNKKGLPRLNFDYNSTVLPPSSDMVDLHSFRKKFNELDTHYLSSHYDNEENETTPSYVAAGATTPIQAKSGSGAKRRRVQSSRRTSEKGSTPGSVEQSKPSSLPVLVPAAAPMKSKWKTISPPSAMTPIVVQRQLQQRSSPPIQSKCNDQSQQRQQQLPAAVVLDVGAGFIGAISSSGAASIADFGSLSNGDDSQLNGIDLSDIVVGGLNSVVERGSPSLLSSYSSAGGQQSPRQFFDYMPIYTLFDRTSPNFFLGERLIAEMHLPWNGGL